MVIINSQKCQLANRLWGFSSFIANSIEYGYELVNIGFSRYSSYFESTAKGKFGHYPIYTTRTRIPFLDTFYSKFFKEWSSATYRIFGKTPTFYKFYRITDTYDKKAQLFDLNRPDYIADARENKILVEGWMFRDLVNVRKHRDKLRQFFTPVEPYYSEIRREIGEARKLADVLIGVHIRRGDYNNFIGGKWYYTDDVYAAMMHQVSKAYREQGKSCAFFVCSNEKVEVDCFTDLTFIYKPRHFIVDLYSLAECDAIIGPPSTFSQWAAFYGDKPLTMLLGKDQKIGIPVYNSSLLPDVDFPEKEVYRFLN